MATLVLAGHNRERGTYNQFSPVQWMAGFCRTMRHEPDLNIRNNRLDYVISLRGDVQDFSWASTNASHAVLLCRV